MVKQVSVINYDATKRIETGRKGVAINFALNSMKNLEKENLEFRTNIKFKSFSL